MIFYSGTRIQVFSIIKKDSICIFWFEQIIWTREIINFPNLWSAIKFKLTVQEQSSGVVLAKKVFLKILQN